MTAITALSKELHGQLKLAVNHNFSQAKADHLLPVVAHEFAALALEYPIVFVKHGTTGALQPVVMTALQQGENLFFSHDSWLAQAVPQILKNYPLVLMQAPTDEEHLLVGVHEHSELLNATEGEALFNADGSESAFLQQRKQQLADFYQQNQITQAFVETLLHYELLSPQTLTLTVNGNKQELKGIYLLNEERLNALSQDDFMQLRNRGFLSPIYAHLLSLRNIQRLAKQAAERLA